MMTTRPATSGPALLTQGEDRLRGLLFGAPLPPEGAAVDGAPPVIWSIAGTDSGGGAGLAADQRAAEACGVHLAPVVAAVTAQNSVAVLHVHPLPPEVLQAQLDALAADLPPRAIKTGLLGSAEAVRAVARVVDALRQRGPVALVVDPVLGATTGATFADEATLRAYREELLPRSTVLTPNRREAARLLGQPEAAAPGVPAQADALRALGVHTVVITGGDSLDRASNGGQAGSPTGPGLASGLASDWLAGPLASGWLSLPRVPTAHHHGTGCTFASAVAAALARGFVAEDAAVLAKMLTTHALQQAGPLGAGAGPVRAEAAFITRPALLPSFWPGPELPPAPLPAGVVARNAHATGVYAIVDSAERVQAVLAAAATPAQAQVPLPARPTLQLRIKRPAGTAPDDAAWQARLRAELGTAIAAARAAGATLYINDHGSEALALGATALHLGQEDLLALTPGERAALRAAQARGLKLGISSHSLWELARAAAWQPAYIACGPVWPTTTKDMPWRPQGLANLAWWARMAPVPVVGIGGVLAPEQLQALAATGAQGGCVVRGLADPAQTLPGWQAAWQRGRAQYTGPAGAAGWPTPCL